MKAIFLTATLTIAVLSAVASAQAPKLAGSSRTAPSQIEIDSKFFTIPADAAARLGLTTLEEMPRPIRGGRLRPAEYQKLLESLSAEKSVKELSAPRVTTKSGQRAVIEIIREFRYPTEFDAANGEQIAPKAFETRHTGVTLEVEPAVSDGELIDLDIRPSVTAFHRFAHYAGGKTRAAGPIPRDGFMQPIFDSSQCSVGVTLRSGQALLLGGFEWHGADEFMLPRSTDLTGAKPEAAPVRQQRLLFVTLTAKLVTPSVNLMDVKAGAPVTITSRLAAVTRDRVPEWIFPKDMQLGSEGWKSQAIINRQQTKEMFEALEAASGGPLSTGPAKAIASNERYFAEPHGWLRYPAGTTAGEATGPANGETASVERVDLQLAVMAQCLANNTIDLDIIPNLGTLPKPAAGGGTGGTSVEWRLLKEEPNWSRKASTTAVTTWSGNTIIFVKSSEGHPDRLQILLITARGSSAGEEAAASGSTELETVPTPPSAQKLPWAKPVEGKRGFVTSPYGPEKGYVDVRGFPTGTEVKCPYSGNTFLVP